jgi:hypothetical protein
MIRLENEAPVAQGGKCFVFIHPDNADWLVKVVGQPDIIRAQAKSAFWHGHERRYRHLKNFLRAIREQIVMMAEQQQASPYIQYVVGLTETDLGIGLMVLAERLAGQLAPTLHDLRAAGALDDDLRHCLQRFTEWIATSPVVVNDLSLKNVVLSDRGGIGRHFVLVDGYGETAAIPLKSWLNWVNRLAMRRKIARLTRLALTP